MWDIGSQADQNLYCLLTEGSINSQGHNLYRLKYILMLIKQRPPQFTGFVEFKHRHGHVLITNLYIVSHSVYDRSLPLCIPWALCACSKEAWVSHTPCEMRCHCSTSWRSYSGYYVVAVMGYKSCAWQSGISDRWSVEGGSGSGRTDKVVWNVQLAGIWHCVAGINSPIDWQNMWVKDFIYIALVCKGAPNYNILCKSNEPLHCRIIQSLGWPSFS